MSTRALRKLREDRDLARKGELLDHVDELDDADAGEEEAKPKVSAFAMMDDSSDEEDADDTSESETDGPCNQGTNADVKSDSVARAYIVKDDNHFEEEEEEDIDAILAEFQDENHLKVDDAEIEIRYFPEVVNGLDARDLDFESALKNNLLGNPTDEQSSNVRRGGRQLHLFGQPRDGWTIRPR
jgi:hypothetical protein